jgi:hypothetical protein
MPQLEAQVLEHLRNLPIARQQEVLNFILFLSQSPQNMKTSDDRSQSFTVAAQQYSGCLAGGPSDLSTNPTYLEGFGS